MIWILEFGRFTRVCCAFLFVLFVNWFHFFTVDYWELSFVMFYKFIFYWVILTWWLELHVFHAKFFLISLFCIKLAWNWGFFYKYFFCLGYYNHFLKILLINHRCFVFFIWLNNITLFNVSQVYYQSSNKCFFPSLKYTSNT